MKTKNKLKERQVLKSLNKFYNDVKPLDFFFLKFKAIKLNKIF